ncbi:MAG TPA: ABC transporter ATP-binding protein [Pseudonocardiaceae bacterium]|jgi:peptide/nickel transport system ATP-binding protein
MSPQAPVLEVTGLAVSFPSEEGRVTAVRELTYRVGAGEVLGIVGESGSGKSVSSMAVMGLLPPQSKVTGSIRFQGRELLGRSDTDLSRIRGSRIAMIFQDPLSALTPVYSVGDQVAEALLVHGDLAKHAAGARAVELLDLVGIPDAARRARAFPHEFSGGMRQRVVIAMAIANDPDLIIADEPTTALDVTVQAQVLQVLQTAREVTGAAIVLITHDLGVVAGFADRVQVMYAGRTVETGSVDEIFYHSRMPYTLGLLGSIPRVDTAQRLPLVPIEGQPPTLVALPPGCPFAPRCPLVVDQCRTTEPMLTTVEVGGSPSTANLHQAACHRSGDITADTDASDLFADGRPAAPAPAPAEPAGTGDRNGTPVALRVEELVRHYPVTKGAVLRRQVGTVRAVDGVSFDLGERETLGLVGESGCGKTTTLMEILNLAAPAQGRIEVLGSDVASLDRRRRKELRRDMQVVFQDPISALDPRMPVVDVLAEPLSTHGFSGAEIRARVPELLRMVGLRPEHASRYPGEFSGGQRQRIGIARALALEPKVLVLDEPVSALDVSIQAGVINLLEELQARLGLAYLFVAHDLAVIRHIADRVAVMYLGKIVEIGVVDAVYRDPRHPYTQALLSAIPIPDPAKERARKRILLTGDLPSPADVPSGCRFRTRCFRYAALAPALQTRCEQEEPSRQPLTDGAAADQGADHGAEHEAACHYPEAQTVL